MRKLIAFAVAPLPALAIVVAIRVTRGAGIPGIWDMMIAAGVFYGVQALFGIPLAALLARLERTEGTSYAAAGAVAVLLPMLSILVIAALAGEPDHQKFDDLVFMLAASAGMGASIGLAYWLIVRPDRASRRSREDVLRIFS